jgi:lipopolysaccharide export system protein LptA
VGAPTLSQRAHQRRQRITGAVAGALAITVLVVVVAYWRRPERHEKAAPPPQPVPTDVDRQLSGFNYTRSEGERRIFSIHANRNVAFKENNSTVLEGVYVEVFGPSGDRHDVLRTERCDYNPNSHEFFAAGKVNIQLNDLGHDLQGTGLPPLPGGARRPMPVYLETSKVSFKQQGSIVETAEPVTFRTAGASGTARGLTYTTRAGELELENDVVLHLEPRGGPKAQPEVTLAASRMRLDKEKHDMTLWGPIEITQGSRRVSAGSGTILFEGGRRVTEARLEDGVRAADNSQAGAMDISAQRVQAVFDPEDGHLRSLHGEGRVESDTRRGGQVSHLSAEQIDFAFTGKHPQPLNGSALGSVRMAVQTSPRVLDKAPPPTKGNAESPQRQELTAAEVRFSFRPGQQTLQQVQTVGAGNLVLFPASPETGKREVFADPLVMDFDAHGRLEELRGLSRARIISHPPALAPAGRMDQESTSNRLKAAFDPATGSLLTTEQVGDFQYSEGDRKASADQAVYDSRTQVITLTGHPTARDPDSRVRSDRVIVDLQKDTVEGLGHVQSTQWNVVGLQAGAGKGRNLPTNVVADRLIAHRDSQLVHYEGHVRAWHGEDVVESPSIDLYKGERRITANSGVLTSYVQAASGAESTGAAATGPRKAGRPVTIRADRVEYSDADRKSTYQGKVELQTENTTLRAERMSVFFSSGSTGEASEVERAVAEGHVSVVQPGRRASGDHAEYTATTGKIVMTGGPPSVYDAANGFTTGRSLTLFLHDDTIFVDGGEKSPTLSKRRITP